MKIHDNPVYIWLGKRERKVFIDQVPAAFAEWSYPLPLRNCNLSRPDFPNQTPPDKEAVKRYELEIIFAKRLRIKFGNFTKNQKISIKELETLISSYGLKLVILRRA